MKQLVMTLCLSISVLYGQHETFLTLYKEAAHFKLYCTAQDYSIADKLLELGLSSFEKNTRDFKHIYSAPIHIEVYPSVDSFHKALGGGNIPKWIVGTTEWPHTSALVSPLNPGLQHNYESMLHIFKNHIAGLFIKDAYSGHIPRWLHQGVAYYQAEWEHDVRAYVGHMRAQGLDFPTLDELDENNASKFASVGGFNLCYSLAEFILNTWGWNTMRALLADYGSFEKTLGVTKDEFRTKWIAFLDETYLNE